MRKFQKTERILIISAVMLLLSILFMIIVIPGVYTSSLPNEPNPGAVIGISLAIVIRLLIIYWYKTIINKIRRGGEQRKSVYIIIGILLLLFGLIYSDGAVAFLNNTIIPYVSWLMFTSVFCDLIASILTFIAIYINREK